jgi:hypothetical protein
MSDAEDWYMMLDSSAGQMPDDVEPWVRSSYESILGNAADMIVKELDPKTMQDVRDYEWAAGMNAYDDRRLGERMVGYLLEKGHDDEADPNLSLFDYLEEIGAYEALEAPIETPAELVEWLIAKHREKFDGAPCAACGKPLPYDDRYSVSDHNGRRHFHPKCGKAYTATNDRKRRRAARAATS